MTDPKSLAQLDCERLGHEVEITKLARTGETVLVRCIRCDQIQRSMDAWYAYWLGYSDARAGRPPTMATADPPAVRVFRLEPGSSQMIQVASGRVGGQTA